jgi:hypothetical protein
MENTTEAAFKVVEEDVSHERLDGEVIAVNLKTGHYYSMSGPAADIWSLICAGVPQKMWAQIVGAAFGAPIAEDDFDKIIAACTDAGLITHAAASPKGDFNLPADYARTGWVAPRLEEFDDMRDLILVDPIHDTTALGWPHIK